MGSIRVERDLKELELFGRMLDWRPGKLQGRNLGEFLAGTLLKVRGKDGLLHPLKPNVAQRAYERRRGAGNIVLKARQMGLTTWVAGRFLLKTICRPGTLSLQVAHTQESAEEMLGIVHRFVENLPVGLRKGALRTSRSSVRQIVFPEIDSEYRVVSAADRNAGRGMTYQNLHCSEVARWGKAGSGSAADVLAGLRAGLAPGGELVLESTPNGARGCFYEEWQRADAAGPGSNGLVRHFFPWWLEPGYRAAPAAEETLTEEEQELMTRPGVGLDLGQIGYRRGIQRGLLGMARQEFVEEPETCFRVSGESYFELELVEKRLAGLAGAPPMRRQNGRLEVWMPPMPRRLYVAAVDPAGGGSEGDFSAIQVLDLETGLQCAEFAGHVSGHELMDLARQIGWDYNTAWLAVERNNHGAGLLWLLEQKGYREIFKGADGNLGYLTTSVSRPQMLARLSAALVEAPEMFQSRKLLAECRSFVRLPNGNVGARSGAHDDRVMAMAVGLAARAELLGKRQGSGVGGQGSGIRDQGSEIRSAETGSLLPAS
jgi:hypothetical protein